MELRLESPRKNEVLATDIMIYVGGTYEMHGEIGTIQEFFWSLLFPRKMKTREIEILDDTQSYIAIVVLSE